MTPSEQAAIVDIMNEDILRLNTVAPTGTPGEVALALAPPTRGLEVTLLYPPRTLVLAEGEAAVATFEHEGVDHEMLVTRADYGHSVVFMWEEWNGRVSPRSWLVYEQAVVEAQAQAVREAAWFTEPWPGGIDPWREEA